VKDSALEPLHVSKAKCAKSIELQERKHTVLQKGAQLKSTGANHKIQSAILYASGRHQSTEKSKLRCVGKAQNPKRMETSMLNVLGAR
jgi:hypothetical protein